MLALRRANGPGAPPRFYLIRSLAHCTSPHVHTHEWCALKSNCPSAMWPFSLRALPTASKTSAPGGILPRPRTTRVVPSMQRPSCFASARAAKNHSARPHWGAVVLRHDRGKMKPREPRARVATIVDSASRPSPRFSLAAYDTSFSVSAVSAAARCSDVALPDWRPSVSAARSSLSPASVAASQAP